MVFVPISLALSCPSENFGPNIFDRAQDQFFPANGGGSYFFPQKGSSISWYTTQSNSAVSVGSSDHDCTSPKKRFELSPFGSTKSLI